MFTIIGQGEKELFNYRSISTIWLEEDRTAAYIMANVRGEYDSTILGTYNSMQSAKAVFDKLVKNLAKKVDAVFVMPEENEISEERE